MQVVFSDVWWIGSKEDNPEEKKLQLPSFLAERKIHEDVAFEDFMTAKASVSTGANGGGDKGRENEETEGKFGSGDSLSDDGNEVAPGRLQVQSCLLREHCCHAGSLPFPSALIRPLQPQRPVFRACPCQEKVHGIH